METNKNTKASSNELPANHLFHGPGIQTSSNTLPIACNLPPLSHQAEAPSTTIQDCPPMISRAIKSSETESYDEKASSNHSPDHNATETSSSSQVQGHDPGVNTSQVIVQGGTKQLAMTKDYHTIISIARRSSRQNTAAVQNLHDENRERYHALKHLIEHSVGPHQFHGTRFRSIVFHGWPSNTDITTRRGPPFQELKTCLNTISLDSAAQGQLIAIIFSGKDGFFLDITGVRNFFRPYRQMNILFFMCAGKVDLPNYGPDDFTKYLRHGFEVHALDDVLSAIGDVLAGVHGSSLAHEFVLDWHSIATKMGNLSRLRKDFREKYPGASLS